MARPKFILSIDGGGIRGLIPAIIIAELERRLAKLGKTEPLAHYFDLIAGTSTGGIIAAGLACPKPKPAGSKEPAYTAAKLVELYELEGGEIFPRNLFTKLKRALLMQGFFEELYDATILEAKLKQKLGDRRLSEALTILVLTAYDIEKRTAVIMSNGAQLISGKPQPDYKMWEAARATSAAPTFFEPALVTELTSGEPRTLVDGGVFASDPGMVAVIEARKQDGWKDEDLVILSIGTGEACRKYPYHEAKNWGAAGWISPPRGSPIISILMHGQASAAAYQLARLYGTDVPSRYIRLDTKLENITDPENPKKGPSDDLDDATPENLVLLRAHAERLIADQSAELDRIADLLTPRPGLPTGSARPPSGRKRLTRSSAPAP